eukprot:TRINITY_DN1919_c0_g4_i1.p1 TRINITY_DN1919_c0_g4~~TRINITY_DN1919_c0_g4_i1.p1  ORF type:complete len:355 (-),score=54.47 TRINITY_DN1919_c0_g4_i1:59-1123(-)
MCIRDSPKTPKHLNSVCIGLYGCIKIISAFAHMSEYDVAITALFGIASAIAALLSMNQSKKYKKAKKTLEVAEVRDIMSPKSAIELIKSTKQKQDCYISGRVKSLNASKQVYTGVHHHMVFFHTARFAFRPSKESKTSSTFLLEDSKVSIPVSTYKHTISFGSKLKGKKYTELRKAIKYGALAASAVTTMPIPLFDVSSSIGEGEYVTAFGTVLYNLRSGAVEMTKAKCLLKGGKKDLVGHLRKEVEVGGIGLFLRRAITVGLIGCCAYSIYRLIRNWRENARRQALQRPAERKDNVLAVNSLHCLTCKRNYRTVTYKDCDHLAVCAKCDSEGSFTNCPVCNKHIKAKSILYLA